MLYSISPFHEKIGQVIDLRFHVQRLIFSRAVAEQAMVGCATDITLSYRCGIRILLLNPEMALKVTEPGLIKILITILYFSKAEQIPDFLLL